MIELFVTVLFLIGLNAYANFEKVKHSYNTFTLRMLSCEYYDIEIVEYEEIVEDMRDMEALWFNHFFTPVWSLTPRVIRGDMFYHNEVSKKIEPYFQRLDALYRKMGY